MIKKESIAKATAEDDQQNRGACLRSDTMLSVEEHTEIHEERIREDREL